MLDSRRWIPPAGVLVGRVQGGGQLGPQVGLVDRAANRPGCGVGRQRLQGRAAGVDHRQPAGQRLQHGQPEGLLRRRRGQHVHRAQQRPHVGDLAGEPDPVGQPEPGRQRLQRGPLGAGADQQQRRVQPGHGPQQDVEPLAGVQPADRTDHPLARPQPQLGPDPVPQVGIEGQRPGVDPVGDHGHPLRPHAPADQPGRHRLGHRDGHPAQPLGGPVEPADPGSDHPAFDPGVAERVLGRDHAPDPGQPGGQAAVHAGAVEVGVDHVVPAAADQPDQPDQRQQVPVAAHPQVGDRDAVGPQRVGDGAGVGQRDHLGLVRRVRQQQPQLVFGPAGGQPGDHVQDPGHRVRTRCRTYLAASRAAVSFSPAYVRGKANCRGSAGAPTAAA